jgi:hypothetical protein
MLRKIDHAVYSDLTHIMAGGNVGGMSVGVSLLVIAGALAWLGALVALTFRRANRPNRPEERRDDH